MKSTIGAKKYKALNRNKGPETPYTFKSKHKKKKKLRELKTTQYTLARHA